MSHRRRLLVAFGVVVSAPRSVFAQAKKSPLVIGWLDPRPRTAGAHLLAAFNEGMTALGWKERADYVLEARWAEGMRDQLPSLALELAAKTPAVIVAGVASATIAIAKAAPNIPVVQASGSSPVNVGLAASLARPGGMVTGLVNISTDVSEKYLELLLAINPKPKRFGFLVDRRSPGYAAYMDSARRAIQHFRVDARIAEVVTSEQVEPAIVQLAKEGVQALVVLPTGTTFEPVKKRIVMLALAYRWPVVSSAVHYVEEGALLSYGVDRSLNYRRAAYYVDRILKGAKPGDLPIEQPMTFDMAVNMKTAKALGLTIPPEIMVRATRVIE